MGSRRRHTLLPVTLLLTLLATFACGKPAGDSFFRSAGSARSEGGIYRFDIDFEDSTASYALDIAARLVASRFPDGSLDLDIRLLAPDGTSTIERLELPLAEGACLRMRHGSGSVTDISWRWRDFSPGGGRWSFLIQPADPAQARALQGLGFSYELNETRNDGKR